MIDEPNKKTYDFWVSGFHYKGIIIDETDSHWIILDRLKGRVELPKGNTIREEAKENA